VVAVACVVVGAEVVGFGGADPVTGELLDTVDMVLGNITNYEAMDVLCKQ